MNSMNNVERAAHNIVEKHDRAGDLSSRVDAKAAALMMDEIFSALKHDKNSLGVSAVDMRAAATALENELKTHKISTIDNIQFVDKGGKNGAPDKKAGKGDQIVVTENARIYGKYPDKSFPLVELFDSAQSGQKYNPNKYSESQQRDANTLYGYLGDSHANFSHLQDMLNSGTHWTRQNEAGKRERDQAMNAFVEKANTDPNCPLKFEAVKDGKHDIGFIVREKRTGKYLDEIKLHDDQY